MDRMEGGLLERFWNAIKQEDEEEEWPDVEEELYEESLRRESLPRRMLKRLIQMDLEMFGDMAEGDGIAAKRVKKLLQLDKKLLEKLEMGNERSENWAEKEGKSVKEKERKLVESLVIAILVDSGALVKKGEDGRIQVILAPWYASVALALFDEECEELMVSALRAVLHGNSDERKQLEGILTKRMEKACTDYMEEICAPLCEEVMERLEELDRKIPREEVGAIILERFRVEIEREEYVRYLSERWQAAAEKVADFFHETTLA